MYSNSTDSADTFDIASQLPKGLQALMHKAQDAAQSIADAALQRRSFLKVATTSGFALGAFPLLTQAQTMATSGAPAASSLKPTQQPSAFVRIDKDGTVTAEERRAARKSQRESMRAHRQDHAGEHDHAGAAPKAD